MAAKSRSQRTTRSAKSRPPKKRAPTSAAGKARKRAAKPVEPGVVEAALAAFAHEVRTPLTGILAISDLLATSDLDQRERRWVDTIKAGAEHLASLATLFVDAARRGNAAAMRQDVFDLRALARSAGNSLAGRAAARALQWRVTFPTSCRCWWLGMPYGCGLATRSRTASPTTSTGSLSEMSTRHSKALAAALPASESPALRANAGGSDASPAHCRGVSPSGTSTIVCKTGKMFRPGLDGIDPTPLALIQSRGCQEIANHKNCPSAACEPHGQMSQARPRPRLARPALAARLPSFAHRGSALFGGRDFADQVGARFCTMTPLTPAIHRRAMAALLDRVTRQVFPFSNKKKRPRLAWSGAPVSPEGSHLPPEGHASRWRKVDFRNFPRSRRV